MENRTVEQRKLEATYIQDESRLFGRAQAVYFPKEAGEVCALLAEHHKNNIPLTVQGARTGLSGAAVPLGGAVMSLEQMGRVLQNEPDEISLPNGRTALAYIEVEAGITMEALDREIQTIFPGQGLCFPVAPTEQAATLGGVLAMGGSGPRGYHYGRMQDYVASLEVCMADGNKKNCKNGDALFETVLGSEGTVAVIASAKLYLVKKPLCCWGVAFFFNREEGAVHFVQAANTWKEEEQNVAELLSIEYIDRATTDLIASFQPYMDGIAGLPPVPGDTAATVLVELAAAEEEPILEAAEVLMGVSMENGADPDLAWAMSTEQELLSLQRYRHAAAECVNMKMAQHAAQNEGVCLLCSDVTLPCEEPLQMLHRYRADIEEAGLEAYLFGHLAKQHLYVNVLPKKQQEQKAGLALLLRWMQVAQKNGGKLWTDHGIGKIKNRAIAEALPSTTLAEMWEKKGKMDKKGILNPENGVFFANTKRTSV